MAELGLIAAVVQVADVGIRLGDKLYTFGQTVASADDSIIFISKDIAYTCSILKILGESLEKDHEEHTYSPSDIKTAETIVKECLEIFQEMDGALLKKITRMGLDGGSSRAAIVAFERLTWPFLKPRMLLLWGHLDKLKSSLQLMLNVFIYAKQIVDRTEDPSVVNDQRITIEHLLRTTAEQSRIYESLKATMDDMKRPEAMRDSHNGCVPMTPGLNAVRIPIEVSDESKVEKVSRTREVDPATTPVENYCHLIRRLITEIEAEGYGIGYDIGHRIRDDVIHIHKRETRLLRAIYGHDELKDRMSESSWELAEMAGDEAEETERLQNASGAIFGQVGHDESQHLDANTSRSPQDARNQKHVEGFERPSETDHMSTMDRAHTSTFYHPILFFLGSGDDPWTPDATEAEEPRAAEGKGWLPSWVPGLGLHKILPLNSLKSHTQDEHMPSLPFLRSGTSMLVTEESHVLESIESSQDLAALTDSSDTETFVSAQSVIGELDLDSEPFCLVEGEKQEPLVVLDDQEYSEAAVKDNGRLGMADLYPPLGELLAAWIN